MSATRSRAWTGARPLAMGGVETSYSGKRRRTSKRSRKRAGMGIRAKPSGLSRGKDKPKW